MKNVYELAIDRIEIVFREFDNIYISFSGGKDSGVMLELVAQYMLKNKITKTVSIFHMNYEAEYNYTTDYVNRVLDKYKDLFEIYNVCVPFKVETSTSMHQTYWRPWDENKKDIWVKKMPKNALTKKDFPFYTEDMWDYDFQIKFSEWIHQQKKAKKTVALVGIRTQESLNRWRAIHSDRNYNNYKGYKWTKKIVENVYNAYPIYDWLTSDVWVANAKFGWDYNKLYDLYYQAGVPIEKQRVASPFISAAKSTLALFKAIEPHTWSKLVSRVNGVNFAGIYGKTTAMGWGSIKKPNHFTWKEYMYFLLDTLPEEIKQGYLEKLATSIKFWREKGGVLSDENINALKKEGVNFVVGDATNYNTAKKPVRMEYQDDTSLKDFKLIPTYKRMCVTIMKNDHLCKYMGFSLTKKETERRKKAIEKYKKIL